MQRSVCNKSPGESWHAQTERSAFSSPKTAELNLASPQEPLLPEEGHGEQCSIIGGLVCFFVP